MNIEDVESSVSFEESGAGVKMFINIAHPSKTVRVEGVCGEFPLGADMVFEFPKCSINYEYIKAFFRENKGGE